MKLFPTLPLLAIALAAGPALAQPERGDNSDAAQIVVTAQRENQTEVLNSGDLGVLGDKDAMEVPFTVRAYDETLILNQQPQTIGEVLENDPTIRTTYGFGNAAEQFVIRGFTLFGDDVGLNGLYGIAPRQLIAPELFDQVQVLNGATAFLNGAAPGGSGIGGSVNLELKRAEADPLTRATLGYTSDEHFGGSFDVGRRFGDAGQFGIRVNGAFRSGDVGIDDEFRRTRVIGAGFDWDGGDVRLSLDLGYQRVEVDRLRPKVTLATTTIPRVPESDANYAQPYTYTDLRDYFGIFGIEWDVADNALFYASFGARDGREDGIYGGITVTDAATGAANGTALFVPRTDNNEAAEAGMRIDLGSAITHEINLGGNISWQTNRNAYDFLYGPGFAGFATNLYDTPIVPIPSSTLVGGDLDDPFPISKTRQGSVFASDTIGFWDDRILLTGGLRLQTIRVESFDYFTAARSSLYSEDAVTPVAGIVIRPTEQISLFANRIEGLQQGPVAPLDPVLVNPGQTFAPFRSTQYEVGGKLELGRFNASLALFQTELPSAFAIPLDPANPAGQQVFGINGEQRNRGIELTLDGEPVDGLRLIGGLAVYNAELRDTAGGANDGNEAVGVPDFTVNANVEWDVPFLPGFTLTGRVVHTGEQQVNQANTLTLEDWTRFDLGARYVFAAGETPVTLRFRVDNIADDRYWASSFDAFNAALLQGAPRTFKLSVSADF
ncbi:MAG: TonB-dependent receptor [Parasphingopyxis sp.]|uniref:TonB-dependent receptor n=1 Tax=Parasphingopyxis sp. TaxID=1920299 RepID=UPI0032F05DA8